jgi:hypothetical protein
MFDINDLSLPPVPNPIPKQERIPPKHSNIGGKVDLAAEYQNFNLRAYHEANSSSVLVNGKYNPCSICGHNDCFVIYDDTNTYHCFSSECESTGNILTYLQEVEGLDVKAARKKFKEIADISEDEGEGDRTTQSTKLIAIVESKGAVFFRDGTETPFAVIPVDEHAEVRAIESKNFKTWLKHIYYLKYGTAINNDCLKQALGVFEGKALFDGEMKPLAVRVTEYEGDYCYDLTNNDWGIIQVSPLGWEVNRKPPVLFARYKHQAEQANPAPTGNVKKALEHFRVKKYPMLFLCWLVACFIPKIPHPMLIFFGEKGAAKTTASHFLKMLIDPSVLDTLSFPNVSNSLVVNMKQHYFLPFDNVSFISETLSDSMCRAVTGSGVQERKLHSDFDDVIYKYMRCLAINGINQVATRPDLLDRSILIELERITESDRKELAKVQEAFEADRPHILGGIFDTVSKAMAIFPTVNLEKLSRMADFDRWGYAIGEAIQIGGGNLFLSEYKENRRTQNDEAINNDTVATLIVEFMRERNEWCGTPTKLYSRLFTLANEQLMNTRGKAFPADPARLSKRLNGIKSNLEMVGIHFERGRTNAGGVIKLTKTPTQESESE